MNRRTVQRLLAVASGAVALAVGNASLASAHHCYKESWADAAYAQISQGNTAWMSLSDLGKQFLVAPDELADCGYLVDEAVTEWMDASGLTQEPLIHSRATIGSGAYYKKGKEPGKIRYLTEDQFGHLTMLVFEKLAENGCSLPDMGGGEDA